MLNETVCVCVLNVDTRQDYIACTASLSVQAYDTYSTFAAPVKQNEDTSKRKIVWQINTTHNRQKAILLKKINTSSTWPDADVATASQCPPPKEKTDSKAVPII